jgi:hypothetical protein
MSDHVQACMQDKRISTQAMGQANGQVEGNLWASYRQAVGKLKAGPQGSLKATYRQAVGKLQANYMQPMGHLSLATQSAQHVSKRMW